jgi:hypothetical protein
MTTQSNWLDTVTETLSPTSLDLINVRYGGRTDAAATAAAGVAS